MPLSLRQLLEKCSAAFERCGTHGGIKSLPKQKTKDNVKPLTSPKPNFPVALLNDEAYDHLLALLSIPAETDGMPSASVPGTLRQEDDSPRASNASGRKSHKCTQGVDSPQDWKPASYMQCGSNVLAQIANKALSVANAQGIPLPCDDPCVHEIDESDLKMMADTYLHFAARMGLPLPGDMHPDDILRLAGYHRSINAVGGKEDVDEKHASISGQQGEYLEQHSGSQQIPFTTNAVGSSLPLDREAVDEVRELDESEEQ